MRQSLFLAVFVLAILDNAVAATPDIAVTLRVQREDGGAIPRAYVALVPVWRPSHRPLAETVAEKGVAILRAPAGSYQVIAGAPGFGLSIKDAVAITTAGVPNLIVQLHPLRSVSGTVSDAGGNPIAGARVATMSAANSPPFAALTALAAGQLSADWSTTADSHGQWTLRIPDGDVPLVFEAPGRAAEWRVVAKQGPPSIDVVMIPGSVLDLATNRIDTDVIVTLALEEGASTIPLEEQPRLWARQAASKALSWKGLPYGRYGIYAKYPEPSYFMQAAAKIGTVTLTPGSKGSLSVTLPPIRRPAAVSARLFLPRVTRETLGETVEAFVPAATGQWRSTESFVEETVGGTVVYLKTDRLDGPFYGRSVNRFFYAPEVATASPDANAVPVTASLHARADGRLRLRFAEKDVAPPRSGTALLRDCGKVRVSVPIEVGKDNLARFTAPAGCQSLVFDFEPFERVVTDKVLQPGDQFVGDVALRAGATADVHVVRDPGGTPVAGATVSAVNQKQITVEEALTDERGWAHLSGLPSYTRLRAMAEIATGDKSDTVALHLAPRERGVVDPLIVPEPATVLVNAKIEEGFLTRFPEARIVAVLIRPDDPDRRSEQQQKDALRTPPPIRFERLHPGAWLLSSVVNVAGTVAPIDIERVEIKPGEARRVDATLAPSVFEGLVTSEGTGVAAKVTVDLDDRRLSFTSDTSGKFRAALPRKGAYRVAAARLQTQGNLIPIGEVPFLDPSQPVEIVIPPGGSVIARVRSGERPVPGALVWLSHRDPEGTVDEMTKRARTTDASGQAAFDDLSAGAWTFSVHDEETRRSAEKMVTINPGEKTTVDLDLVRSTAIEGKVKDLSGTPLPHALVDCLFVGATGLPSRAGAESDFDGLFVVDLTPPAPQSVLCSVVGYTGAVDAFKATPGRPAEITFSGTTGSLRIPDWNDTTQREALCLVAEDGRVISMTGVAAAIGGPSSTLIIPALPAGRWNVIRAHSVPQWLALASGLGNSLPPVQTITLRAGSTETLRLGRSSPQSGSP